MMTVNLHLRAEIVLLITSLIQVKCCLKITSLGNKC